MERLHMNVLLDVISRLRRGQSVRGVARDVGLCRNTVKKYRDEALAKGFLEAGLPLPGLAELELALVGGLAGRAGRPPGSGAWLRERRELIDTQRGAGVEVQAMFERLRSEHGFAGSYSTLRRFVKELSGGQREVFCRVETAPGEEAQVDFGYAGLCQGRKVWVFVMTLSWSRHMYIQFVHDQSTATWLDCHERAFRHFGGVPARLVVDNLKAAMFSHLVHDPVVAEPYRRLARHCGFVISPNRPRTPRHKGKVESGVHYVKRNMLAGRTFPDLSAMNAAGLAWVREHAGTRLHGTTRERPLVRFEEAEKGALLPLPGEEFEWVSAAQCRVGRDCHVTVEGAYYSVPYRHVGTQVDVYIGRRIVEIYAGTTLLATHERASRPGERITRLEHYPEGKRARLENTPERCRERAEGVGEACRELVATLLSDRVVDRIGGVQALLRLGEKHGNDRLEAACRRALHFGDGTYRRVKTILAAGLDADAPQEQTATHAVDGGGYRFARPASSFFEESSA